MIGRISAKSLGTTDESIMQVTSGGNGVVHGVYVVNSSSSARTIRLHHCRNGETGAPVNALLYDVALAAKSTLIDSTRFVMQEGDELRASANGSGVALVIYGQLVP